MLQTTETCAQRVQEEVERFKAQHAPHSEVTEGYFTKLPSYRRIIPVDGVLLTTSLTPGAWCEIRQPEILYDTRSDDAHALVVRAVLPKFLGGKAYPLVAANFSLRGGELNDPPPHLKAWGLYIDNRVYSEMRYNTSPLGKIAGRGLVENRDLTFPFQRAEQVTAGNDTHQGVSRRSFNPDAYAQIDLGQTILRCLSNSGTPILPVNFLVRAR